VNMSNKILKYYWVIFVVVLGPIFYCFLGSYHKKDNIEGNLQFCSSVDKGLTVGNLRLQFLSDGLLRVEKKQGTDFENEHTFTVVDRDWPCVEYKKLVKDDSIIFSTKKLTITVDHSLEKTNNLSIKTASGDSFFELSNETKIINTFLPEPKPNFKIWAFPDTPRIVPPPWGATPVPDNQSVKDPTLSGWRIDSEATDLYIFVPGKGGYEQFRKDFLKLTGPIPLPPLYVFGLWYSRYHVYTEESALQTIQNFRERKIPLDVFVLDTDWRIGGSDGYDINEALFPNIERFINDVHNQNVFLAINDHPKAVSEYALDPKEVSYRYSHLTRILNLGVDAWWFDRNWYTHLKTPDERLSIEVWGMRVYKDVTQRFRPNRRPLILSNVDGIDHGESNQPSHPAAHRYPIWWTGDTKPEWSYLQKGVANAVNSGITRMMPYVSEDIGGHTGIPTDEFYIRSLQYGTFSPILRLHSSGGTRLPWDYSASAAEIAVEYIRLRYRLLPYIYGAARRAYDDGTPMLRRCDLFWPEYEDAKSDQQYLFGDDLLVAPVVDGKGLHHIPDELLHTIDGQQGLTGSYFDNMELSGVAALVRVDANVHFDWGEGKGSQPAEGLPEDLFSVRWEGKVGPVPSTGDYQFGITSDDGLRLWVGGQKVIDYWKDQGASLHTGKIHLKKGGFYDLKLEYYDHQYKAFCEMTWWNVDDQSVAERILWVPPGSWQDMWSGEIFTGPQKISISSPLWHIPIFARQGGIILSIPQIEYTRENRWNDLVVDVFPDTEGGKTLRMLYEDDGDSVSYTRGEHCKTPLILENTDSKISLTIGQIEGDFQQAVDKRTWTLRFHLGKGAKISKVTVDDTELIVQKSGHKIEGQKAILLSPEKNTSHQIFSGRGERPKSQSGSILEVTLPNCNVKKGMLIRLEKLNSLI